MSTDEFLELIRDLTEFEAKNLLSYLKGYYDEDDKFFDAVLAGISSIKESRKMFDSQ